MPARLAILISGHGTNLQAFIDACARGELAAQIGIVITNNPEAAGLQRAESAGLATRAIDHRNFATREEFDQALVNEFHAFSIDLVVLAGIPLRSWRAPDQKGRIKEARAARVEPKGLCCAGDVVQLQADSLRFD